MWVYLGSKRTGRWEAWKVSAEGGEGVQVTRNGGGWGAFESLDGRSIYYSKGDSLFSTKTLWKMPVSSGQESQVLSSIRSWGFSLVKDGIYFTDDKSSVQFLSFAKGKVRTVAPLSRHALDLALSPDGRFLLFTQHDEEGSDLMLVENFW